jgi:Tfp pilus assembly protein PilO
VTGRRAPIIAGIGVLAVCILVIVVVLLPKLHSVSAARARLDEVRAQQQVLQGQVAALNQAREEREESRAIINDVDSRIPETADPQGVLLLLTNAATDTAVTLTQIAPSAPAFDSTTSLSSIAIGLSVDGTYFELVNFLSKVETLPRAAKVTSLSLGLSSEAAAGSTPELNLQITVTVYTQDANAGPGSSPGPTAPNGVAATGG